MGLWGTAVNTLTAADASIALTGTPTDPIVGAGILASRLVLTAKNGAYTAAAGEFVLADTTSNAVPITLPTAPADKTQVGGKITTSGAFGASLVCGGSDVINRSGGPTTYPLSMLGHGVTLQYKAGSPGIWIPMAGDTPLGQTDLRYQNIANLVSSGEETIPRTSVAATNLATTTQTMRLTYFTARKSETTSAVRTLAGATAAAATPTLCKIGLYSIDPTTGDGTLVASTANDTSLWASSGTAYPKSWSTPYAKVAGQRYALAILVVTSAAAPTMAGFSGLSSMVADLNTIAPRLVGHLTSQSDLPSSFLGSAVNTTSAIGMYYGLLT